MRTGHLIFSLTLVLSFYSCLGPSADFDSIPVFGSNKKARNFKLDNAKDFQIKIVSPDTIRQESLLNIFIHIDNPRYKIRNAFYGCKMTLPPTVDTLEYYIKGCEGQPALIIENDTVKISGQTAAQTGDIALGNIILLAVDKNNNFYYDTCAVKYYVK